MTPPIPPASPPPLEGRHWRAVLGTVVIAVALAQFLVRHAVLPLLTKTAPAVTWQDVALPGLLVVCGWALVNKDSLLEVVDRVKDKLPFTGR